MVDILLDRALIVAPVAQLALDQRLAVLSADDGGEPVAESASQNLEIAGGVLCAVRDRVWAFDGNGADGARNAVALLVEVLHLGLHGGWVEAALREGLQERYSGVPPGEESGCDVLYACRRAFCSSTSACPRLVTLAEPSVPPAPTAVPRSVPPMPARPSNVVESIRAFSRSWEGMWKGNQSRNDRCSVWLSYGQRFGLALRGGLVRHFRLPDHSPPERPAAGAVWQRPEHSPGARHGHGSSMQTEPW